MNVVGFLDGYRWLVRLNFLWFPMDICWQFHHVLLHAWKIARENLQQMEISARSTPPARLFVKVKTNAVDLLGHPYFKSMWLAAITGTGRTYLGLGTLYESSRRVGDSQSKAHAV